MSKVNATIQERIAAAVIEANKEREPSGRLAASRLGWPLQWQMLHYFKVPQKSIEEYTLRKFVRGKDVEDRIVAWVKPDQAQVLCEYRGVFGFADMVMEYPIEVKSCTNMAFKHRQKEGVSRSHRLQGELYAKALGYDKFAVAYVASDDYRVLCLEQEVTNDTDKVIDRYETQVAIGVVPEFIAEEKWQAMEDYNPYPEWADLTEKEIDIKLGAMGIAVPVVLPLTTQ